tara:strand:- start:1100 stop:1837 length:738 start_codon:yes stop_codon:yes gene_type:complete
MTRQIFNRTHLYLPLIFFILALSLDAVFGLDLHLADWLFNLQDGSWALRDSWLTQNFLHTGGRNFSVLLALLLLILISASYAVEKLKPLRRGLWMVFVAAFVSALVVSLLKSVTHQVCPWDINRYGGVKPLLSFFQSYAVNTDVGGCFPAGHASAGYSWFGLYFFARQYAYGWRFHALIIPVGLGLIFGFDQQLRGAHFLSHDIWTAGICWMLALAMSMLFKTGNFPTRDVLLPGRTDKAAASLS